MQKKSQGQLQGTNMPNLNMGIVQCTPIYFQCFSFAKQLRPWVWTINSLSFLFCFNIHWIPPNSSKSILRCVSLFVHIKGGDLCISLLWQAYPIPSIYQAPFFPYTPLSNPISPVLSIRLVSKLKARDHDNAKWKWCYYWWWCLEEVKSSRLQLKQIQQSLL